MIAIPVGSKPLGVAVTPDGSKVYVANNGAFPPVSGNVSVIDTESNTVITTIAAGAPGFPAGVAVTPDGNKVYVLRSFFSVSGGGGVGLTVIDTTTNTRIAEVPIRRPFASVGGEAVSPDGSKVYGIITDTVSVVDTATNTVTATITVGSDTFGVAVSPDGSKVYVANDNADTVSVIDTATNTVTATITVGSGPFGVAVTPDGSKAYVAISGANTVSVINTATNTVKSTITDPSFNGPVAFGQFIQPVTAKKFAGAPGRPNCRGVSASALASQYGGLPAAAEALGYPDVQALRTAFRNYCEGV
jgi:YVTN family beta-propeller protein